MKRELGFGRCGLACCLCSENDHCEGCATCHGLDWCENRRCSLEKGIASCAACGKKDCQKGLLAKVKPYGFTLFIRRYGAERLMDCLEKKERQGVIYHRKGINGDYDAFEDAETLISFLLQE